MEILQYPNDVLTTKCGPYDFKFFTDDLLNSVDMVDLMLNHKNCLGLAANQVGISKRFFVMREGLTGARYCFYPKIISHGRDIEVKHEKCMSLPGKIVAAPRWRIITVEYINESGTLIKTTLKGLEARVFQHESDHLDGKLIIKTEADQ